MMLSTLAFTLCALLAAARAQETFRCDCALFSTSQMESDHFPDNVAGLYGTFFEVEPYWCTSPPGGNQFHACKNRCLNWFGNLTDAGFNYCTRTPEASERCYGGLMCEVLYNDGFNSSVGGDSVWLHYRMPECPLDHKDWVALPEIMDRPICCDQGLYDPCNGVDCNCYKGGVRGYCECGVFVPEQFSDSGFEEGLTALPFHYVGNLTDEFTPGVCLNFGSPIEALDPCRANCEEMGSAFMVSYRLNQYPPGVVDFTYGESYCLGLKSRYVGTFPGLNTRLQVYQRAPDCPEVGWLGLEEVTHPETLCCAQDTADHIYPCIAADDAPAVQPAHW